MSVKLQKQRLLIQAPRELVFQIISAIGKGKLPGSQGEMTRVLHQEGNTIIAQFTTRVGRRMITTVEQVKLYPPERITFEHLHLSGPLDSAWEEVVLRETPSGTELEYTGEFQYLFPLLGWFISHLYIKPRYNTAVREHLNQVKVAAEAQARRSHIFRHGVESRYP